MQPRFFASTIFLIAVLVVAVGLVISGSVHPDTIPQVTQPSETPAAESFEVRAKAVPPDPTTAPTMAQPAATQVTSSLDGPSLLENNCSQCHMVRLLERSRKSRTGWEKTLANMEERGVRLSDSEKAVLLDYLTLLRDHAAVK